MKETWRQLLQRELRTLPFQGKQLDPRPQVMEASCPVKHDMTIPGRGAERDAHSATECLLENAI